MKDDLWGVLPAPDTTTLPANILKEQGALLSEKTNGILTGKTSAKFAFEEGREVTLLDFYIVCPTLNNYRYEVLQVTHPRIADIFPAEIFCYKTPEAKGQSKTVANDIEEFKKVVKDVLQSERVKKVISALLRDAQDFDNQTPF